MEHLKVLEETDTLVVLGQDPEEYADWWEFRAKWDGCINYMQHDPGDPNSSQVVAYAHICSAKQFIAMLTEVNEYCRAKWGEDWDS